MTAVMVSPALKAQKQELSLQDRVTYNMKVLIAILQTSRWDAVLSQMKERAGSYDLSAEFVSAIFNAIHEESVQEQNKILSDGEE